MTQNFFEKDAIFEAIKREDFVKKVKKALPWVVGAAVLVLLSTLGWVFYQHKKDNYLFEREQAFVQLLDYVKKEKWHDVKRVVETSFPEGEDDTQGFAYLAKLYHLAALQNDMKVLPSQITQKALQEAYQNLKAPSASGANFVFLFGQGFLALDFPQFFSIPSESLRDTAFPQHSFYEAGLMLSALQGYLDGASQLDTLFSTWENKPASPFQWMATYCKIGSSIVPQP